MSASDKVKLDNVTDTKYKLNINGTTSGESTGTNLGTVYAPSTTGQDGQVIMWDESQGRAVWGEGGSNISDLVEMCTVTLSTTGNEYDSELNGVTIEFVVDGQTTTKVWNGSAVSMNILSGTSYSVVLPDVADFTTPAGVSTRTAVAGNTHNLNAVYTYRPISVTVGTNQSNLGLTDLISANATVTINAKTFAINNGQSNTQTFTTHVATTNNAVPIQFSNVTGYRTPSITDSGSNNSFSVTYDTEIFTITSVTSDNESVNGQSITVNNETKTWSTESGYTLSWKIPYGNSDVVTATKTGYDVTITKNPNTDTANSSSKTCAISFEEVKNVVELGLDVKWATGNIVKNNGVYSIGGPTDAGAYFAWGETVGYNEGEGHNFSSSNYTASSISANLSLSQDAARVRLGSPWRMPTRAEYDNLISNTVSEWGTLDGVNGRYFYKKDTNGNKVAGSYIFFPAVGNFNGTSLNYSGTYGYYWSATYYDSSSAYFLGFSSSYVSASSDRRRYGMPIRPVQDK
jgi:uncharacterized protein (TIGR02145 family)